MMIISVQQQYGVKGAAMPKKVPPKTSKKAAPPPPPPESDESTPADSSHDEEEEREHQTDHKPEPYMPTIQGKKIHLSDHLSTDQEQALAEWFQDHPCFYDQGQRTFKDRQLKDRLLTEKALEIARLLNLHVTIKDVTSWWHSMRTMYGKIFQRSSGDGKRPQTPRQRWIRANFEFLREHVVPKTKSKQFGKIPSGQTQAASEPQAFALPCSDDEDEFRAPALSKLSRISSGTDIGRASTTPTSNTSQGSTKRRKRVVEAKIDYLLTTLEHNIASTGDLGHSVDRPILGTMRREQISIKSAFAAWLSAEIEALPDDLMPEFQMKTFGILMDLKQRALHRQQYQQQYSSMPPPIPQQSPQPSTSKQSQQ
ncbi:uncharacterized protein LOC132883076 isoform X3 [Neoarius graeffei]|uniref:uncharacterized protein LOC132883076 isoform X3 n=1 Tax=Neoarius graeffei TaxID=443677 RepID=UPI00298C3B74|nr:uncharacterized protein LOC132883076 isoform X3 [Neoarius graeffei]